MNLWRTLNVAMAATLIVAMVAVGAVGAVGESSVSANADATDAITEAQLGGAHALIGSVLCTQADDSGNCQEYTYAATAYQVAMLAPAACAATGGTACAVVLGYIA